MKTVFSIIFSLFMLNSFTQTVKIGNQEWSTKNLDVSTFRNGDPIPYAKSAEEWKRAGENKQPAYCYLKFNSNFKVKYGKFYNGYAIIDSRGLAPEGWHIPNKEEWISLFSFKEIDATLKEKGKYDYNDSYEFKNNTCFRSKNGWVDNLNGDNSTGLNVYPTGFVNGFGIFDRFISDFTRFWTSSYEDHVSPSDVHSKQLYLIEFWPTNSNLFQDFMDCGYPVRCIQGNMNKVQPTVRKSEYEKYPKYVEKSNSNQNSNSDKLRTGLFEEDNSSVSQSSASSNSSATERKSEYEKYPKYIENSGFKNSQTKDFECQLDGKLFFSNALSYVGFCSSGKANGWGTLEFPSYSKSAFFRNNEFQNLLMTTINHDDNWITIGPNVGDKFHGPCISISGNHMVQLSVRNMGKYESYDSDILLNYNNEKIEHNEFYSEHPYDQPFSGYGHIIPNTSKFIYISQKEYNTRGDRKYWIRLIDLELNKKIFDFGSFSKPIYGTEGSSNFLKFSANNEFAYFDIKPGFSYVGPPKILQCNLNNGEYIFINELPLEEDESKIKSIQQEIYSRVREGFQLRSIGNFELNKYAIDDIIFLDNGNYLTVEDKKLEGTSYNKVDGYNTWATNDENQYTILSLRDKNHNLINSKEFKNIKFNRLSVSKLNNSIAINFIEKDSSYIEILNLNSFKANRIFASEKDVAHKFEYSTNGNYLFYARSHGTLIFRNNDLFFAVPGVPYGLNNSETTIITNDRGELYGFDLELRRLIFGYEMPYHDDTYNSKMSKFKNDVFITTRQSIIKLPMPQPIVNLTDYVSKSINKQELIDATKLEISNSVESFTNNNLLKDKNMTQKKLSTEINEDKSAFEAVLKAYIYLSILETLTSSGSDDGNNNSSSSNSAKSSGKNKCLCGNKFADGEGWCYKSQLLHQDDHVCIGRQNGSCVVKMSGEVDWPYSWRNEAQFGGGWNAVFPYCSRYCAEKYRYAGYK